MLKLNNRQWEKISIYVTFSRSEMKMVENRIQIMVPRRSLRWHYSATQYLLYIRYDPLGHAHRNENGRIKEQIFDPPYSKFWIKNGFENVRAKNLLLDLRILILACTWTLFSQNHFYSKHSHFSAHTTHCQTSQNTERSLDNQDWSSNCLQFF